MLELVLVVGLTARLIRFTVVDDAGTVVFRPALRLGRLVAGDRGIRFVEALFFCPFCIGFWIAIGVAAGYRLWGDTNLWQVAALAGTLSYVGGHLVATLDRTQPGDD